MSKAYPKPGTKPNKFLQSPHESLCRDCKTKSPKATERRREGCKKDLFAWHQNGTGSEVCPNCERR
jgi:hypothetical protein